MLVCALSVVGSLVWPFFCMIVVSQRFDEAEKKRNFLRINHNSLH
jgi:hypothetical protein